MGDDGRGIGVASKTFSINDKYVLNVLGHDPLELLRYSVNCFD
jgi:hypothetical protein